MATRLVRRYLASATVEEWPAFKAHYLLGDCWRNKGTAQTLKLSITPP